MAFQIKGTPFINDNRELVNIISIGSTTGLVTFTQGIEVSGALTLSGTGGAGDISADNISLTGSINAPTGVVTAQSFVGDGSGITNVLGTGAPGAGGETTVDDDLLLNGTLEVVGGTTLTTLDGGAADLASLQIKTGGSLTFADDTNAIDGVGIGSDLGDTTPSDSILPTQKAVKEYVDGQIQETGGSISFAGDAGAEAFDISDGVFSIVGTPGEIVTDASALAPDGTLQIGLSTSVTIEEDLTVTRNAVVTGLSTFSSDVEYSSSFKFGEFGVGISSVTADDTFALATDAQLPTALAVKSYVDGEVTGGAQLNITDGLGGNDTLQLPGDTLTFTGNADNVTATVTDNEVTFALAADSKVTSSLIVGEGLGAGAGDLLTASATATDGTPGVAVAGDLKVSGNVDSASDAKLKENIEVIPAAMEKVAALRGVSYNWISSGKASAGIIAQEVQAVMPELVTEGESHLTVQYNGLVGLLIEAVKEQQAQIEELKAKLG